MAHGKCADVETNKMARAKKKVIAPPIDEVGKQICWRPHPSSDLLYGEVVNVGFTYHAHPKYPNTSLRELRKVLTVMIPDGRVFKMSGEHEDLKKRKVVEAPEL